MKSPDNYLIEVRSPYLALGLRLLRFTVLIVADSCPDTLSRGTSDKSSCRNKVPQMHPEAKNHHFPQRRHRRKRGSGTAARNKTLYEAYPFLDNIVVQWTLVKGKKNKELKQDSVKRKKTRRIIKLQHKIQYEPQKVRGENMH